jgi:hypothetical protein
MRPYKKQEEPAESQKNGSPRFLGAYFFALLPVFPFLEEC